MQVIPRLQDIPLVTLTEAIRGQVMHAVDVRFVTVGVSPDIDHTWFIRCGAKRWLIHYPTTQDAADYVLHKEQKYYVKTEVTPFPISLLCILTALGCDYKAPRGEQGLYVRVAASQMSVPDVPDDAYEAEAAVIAALAEKNSTSTSTSSTSTQ